MRTPTVIKLAALAALTATLVAGAVGTAYAVDPFDVTMQAAQSWTRHRTLLTYEMLTWGSYTQRTSAHYTAYPWYTAPSGAYHTRPASYWSSGYWPGSLWLQYERASEPGWRQAAASWQATIGAVPPTPASEDAGVRYFPSYANAYRLTGARAYRLAGLAGAASTAGRFNPKVGLLRSRNVAGQHQTVVDELMNLQLLYWAARNGGSAQWRSIATSHALTAARDFVRADGTTYHLNVYDPNTGALLQHGSPDGQGYAPDSTWARGQAWAVFGFSNAYRESRDPRLLATARLVADKYLAMLPADLVPYWDFDRAGIPGEPRDSSAAAIAAAGLVDLSLLETDTAGSTRYAKAARDIVTSLVASGYLTTGTDMWSVLRHGTYDKPHGKGVDAGMTWGDYFLEEAILKMRSLPVTAAPLPIAGFCESGHVGSDGPVRIADGDEATTWTSYGGQWIDLDLGSVRPVSKISILIAGGTTRSAPFTIMASSRRKTWTTLTSARTAGRWGGYETFDLPDTEARFVRILCGGTTSSLYNKIAEVRLY